MRNHFVRAATLLLATLLLTSGVWSASLSAQLTEADLLGCYDVTEGEWTAGRVFGLMRSGDELLTDTSALRNEPVPSSLGLDSAYLQIPPRIRLAGPPADTTFFGGAAQIVVPEDALPTPHVYMTWGVEGSSLRLGFSTGFHGVGARLEPEDRGTWAGTSTTFSDNLPYRSWARPIELTAVDCDAPSPVPSSVMRSVPSAVQLVGGATITLGEPLPESLETLPRRSGALTVIGRTEGLFGTTDSIAVGMDEARGRVGRIQLIYLDPDMSSVIGPRLADAFGSPAGSAIDPTGVEWRNRIRRVWLRRGTRFTVNLRDYRYLW